MKKKLLSAVLSVALLFSSAAFADEIKEKTTVYCNGAQITVPDDFTNNDYYRSCKYTTVAELVGYTTTYNADTRTVVSTKENRTVSIPLDETAVYITENGNTQKEETYSFTNIDGKLYCAYYEFSELLNTIINCDYDYSEENSTASVYIYDIDKLSADFTQKSKNLTDFFEKLNVSQYSNQTATGKIDYSFVSETFGTNITGSCNMTSNYKKSDSAMYCDIKADTSGIMNLISLLMQTRKSMPSVDKPIDFKLYTDANGVYMKSELLNEFIINNSVKRLYSVDSENIFKQAENKWLFSNAGELDSAEITQALDALNSNEAYTAMLSENLVTCAVMMNQYNYDGVIKTLDSFVSLFDKNHVTYTKSGDTEKLIWKLSEKDIKAIADVITPNEVENKKSESTSYVEELINNLDFASETEYNLYPGGRMDCTSDMSITFNKIPNSWGIDIGKMTFKITQKGSGDTTEPKITVPNASELFDLDALQKDIDEKSAAYNEKFDL